jgi:hypothetical protein
MSSEDTKHRSHPIPTPERTGLITYDAKDPDTKFPPIEQLHPPKGAPNVLAHPDRRRRVRLRERRAIPMTQAMVFSADDGCDVLASPEDAARIAMARQ